MKNKCMLVAALLLLSGTISAKVVLPPVIVVGPELKMGECGIPKLMAAELYKPFIIRKLIERGIVKTVKSAKKIVDRKEAVIWDILEHVMKGLRVPTHKEFVLRSSEIA